MRTSFRIVLVLGMALLLAGCVGQSRIQQASGSEPKTFVIVHGAWGGGWAFRQVDDLLSAQGHKVYRPTLTGQGERVHLASLDVGLDTHIQDVVNTILFEELQDVVMVGHSYGGMVVTGAADRIPDRIEHLIYLDAFIPQDGENCMGSRAMPERDSDWINRAVKDGFLIPSWVDPDKPAPKDVPHPIKTMTDAIVLKNPDRLRIPTSYILTVDPGKKTEDDTFFPSAERAKKLGWPVYRMQADHNPQWSAPQDLVTMLNKTLKLHPDTSSK